MGHSRSQVGARPIVEKRQSSKGKRRGPSVGAALLKLAGKAKGLPADAARNLDHYLYGRPKR
jgi:hypothetical protein